ncbi:MAG: hypothetical protein JO256_12845 [Alphaproteobacteria bacterium]|nr:hypothetical protein [Alphaproteobacteria bacterium]
MSEILVLRALLFAGECFAASLLLPVLAFAAAALLRRQAALRHLVFTTMFGVLALLPLVALVLPPRRIVEHVVAPAAMPVMAAQVTVAPPPPSLRDLLTADNIVLLLLALWLAGFAWQMLRLVVGGLGLVRLRRASTDFSAQIATGCAVRLSRREVGPSTFGIVRPVVLLPRSAQSWPPARLEAVLRHEAAHVARRDALSQFIARLVCTVFWPNPLLWLAARSQRRAAEIAADDAVLAAGLAPSAYAAELVSLAAERQGVAPGIAMAGPPLAERVRSVLSDNSLRKGVSKMDMAKTLCFGLAATLLLGAARFDLAVAEDVAPPAPRAENNIGLTVGADRNVELKAGEAQVAQMKAKADAVVAKAKAKAAAETDPAKRAQYAIEAERVAAEAARTKAEADQVLVRARQRLEAMEPRLAEMRQKMAEDRARLSNVEREAYARAEDARREAYARLEDARREGNAESLNREERRLAEAIGPKGEPQSSAAQSADSTISVNGRTITTRRGTQPNSDSNSNTNNGLTLTTPSRVRGAPNTLTLVGPRDDAAQMFMQQERDGVRINLEINPGADAMNRPEVRSAIDAAMADASRKISAAIAEARAKAGLPPAPAPR